MSNSYITKKQRLIAEEVVDCFPENIELAMAQIAKMFGCESVVCELYNPFDPMMQEYAGIVIKFDYEDCIYRVKRNEVVFKSEYEPVIMDKWLFSLLFERYDRKKVAEEIASMV